MFSDFVSVQAFFLIFVGLILVSCAAALLRHFSPARKWLQGTLTHTQRRLVQMISSSISFMAGLSVFLLARSIITATSVDLKVVAILAFASVVLAASCVLSMVTARSIQHPAGGALMILVVLGALGWMLHVAA